MSINGDILTKFCILDDILVTDGINLKPATANKANKGLIVHCL